MTLELSKETKGRIGLFKMTIEEMFASPYKVYLCLMDLDICHITIVEDSVKITLKHPEFEERKYQEKRPEYFAKFDGDRLVFTKVKYR